MIILAAKERRKDAIKMKEMIGRGRMEKVTGDRTTRPHYIKRNVEFR